MSPIDLAPPAILAPAPKLWTPAKPFIIRATDEDHKAVKAMPFMAAIAGGARRSGRATISKSYIGDGRNTADKTTYDFGNFSMPFDGLMIVASGGRSASNRTFSSISIGGTNGTIHSQTSGNLNCVGIASREVSAGNQNVTVTFSGNEDRAAAFVWALRDYNSATPVDSDSSNGNSTSGTITLDYGVNGLGFYIAILESTGTITWPNATQDGQFTSEIRFAAATKSIPAGATANTETPTWSSTRWGVAGASWA